MEPNVMAGIAMLVSAAAVLVMTILGFIAAPARAANRAFAGYGITYFTLILCFGMGFPTAFAGPMGRGLYVVALMATAAYGPMWLRMTSLATAGPLLRPFARPLMQRALLALAVVAAVAAWAGERVFDVTLQQVGLILYQIVLAIALFVLVGAFLAWRQAPTGSLARRRVTSYLAAFVLHDLLWIAALTTAILRFTGAAPDTVHLYTLVVTQTLVTVVFVPLVLYGLFASNLFHIERRFRLGIKHTTAVALVGGAFLIITESVEASLGIDNAVVSVAAAVGLFLAFRPVQRLSERFATRLIPEAPDVDTMHVDKRLVMYEEQVRLAWQDNVVTDAERRMLDRFRAQLRLSKQQTRAIEQQASA